MIVTSDQDSHPATTLGPPPPIDPELMPTLRTVQELLPARLTIDIVGTLRGFSKASDLSPDDVRREGAFDVEQRTIAGPEGAPDLPVVIFRPTGVITPDATVYYIPGGGMISGGPFAVDVKPMLDHARRLQLAVVSVGYRLAPENPHPAPVEDCYAGLLWLHAHAEELGLRPERIVIAGASAGGGLAAATTLLARDRGGPEPVGCMLICPMLDDRCDTPSALQLEGTGVWDRQANLMGWTALLGDRRGTADVPPYAAPARATDLSGLPPTFIDAGACETFRDEAIAYASRIWQAGGHAELHVWPGAFHGFDVMMPQAQISQASNAAKVNWLRRVLAV